MSCWEVASLPFTIMSRNIELRYLAGDGDNRRIGIPFQCIIIGHLRKTFL